MNLDRAAFRVRWWLGLGALAAFGVATPAPLGAQGVTTGSLSGLVTDTQGTALPEATVVAVHVPSGTRYRAIVRQGGAYTIPNMRVGGPYRVTTTYIGTVPNTREDVSGTSTVIARNDDDGAGLQCITVSDVIIVKGEETRADKRMCRRPPAARYAIAAA